MALCGPGFRRVCLCQAVLMSTVIGTGTGLVNPPIEIDDPSHPDYLSRDEDGEWDPIQRRPSLNASFARDGHNSA